MAQCIVCGKKSLFLRVNQFGRCSSCQEQIELNEYNKIMDAAEKYYDGIVKLFSDLQSSITFNSDPIERLNEIHKIDQKLDTCENLLQELKHFNSIPFLEKVILNHIVFEDDFGQRNKFGQIDNLPVYVWCNHQNYMEEILSDLQKSTNKYINIYNRLKRTIHKYASFQKTINSLDRYPINYSSEKVSKLSLSNVSDLKYSSITSKTNYDKLGTFVVIDTETTGLSASKNEIIEIAAVLFEHWEPQKVFTTLIKPKKELSQEITDITGITPEMLYNCPSISEVIPSLAEFIGNLSIVGHNLSFDINFLYRNGLDFLSHKHKYYDTLEISKKTLKTPKKKWDKELECYEIDYESEYDVEDYKLTTLCDYYDIRDNSSAHRAVSDCLATGYLLQHLAKEKITDII